jgi:DNA-binding GntR family transcriptional regulator
MSDAPPDTDEFWESHNAFHLALMNPVMTPRLQRVITDLWHAGERYVRIVYVETDALFKRSPDARHRPLLVAARSRNAAKLSKAIGQHLSSDEREILKTLGGTLANQPGA